MEDGVLYFATWFIAGYVDINQNDKKVYEFAADGFYRHYKNHETGFYIEHDRHRNLRRKQKRRNENDEG